MLTINTPKPLTFTGKRSTAKNQPESELENTKQLSEGSTSHYSKSEAYHSYSNIMKHLSCFGIRNEAPQVYGSAARFKKFSHLMDTDELDVTQEQRKLFHELKEDKNFQHFISHKDWNNVPEYMNHLILVKKQIQDKNPEYRFSNLHGFLDAQRRLEKENHTNAKNIRNALKGQRNEWKVKLREAKVNPYILHKIDKEIKEFTPKVQDQDAFLLTVVNNVLAVKNEMKTRKIGNITVEEYFNNLPKDWPGSSPWYNVYGDKFKHANGETGFRVLAQVLPHIKSLGCKNIYLLPHLESPGGDGGYDPSGTSPAKRLGGEEGYKHLLDEILKRNMTLTTDLVIGHVSPEHEWFKKAVNGDPKYYQYFIKSPKHWPRDFSEEKNIIPGGNGKRFKLVFDDRGKHGEMVQTERDIIFSDFSKTNWVNTAVKGLSEKVPMNHTFYTFQMDLDVYNPHVLDELLKINSKDILLGAAGTRVDAPGLTVKNIGGGNDLQPQSKNFYNMLSLFRKACHENTMTMPEFPEFDNVDASLESDQGAGIKIAGVVGDYPAFFKYFGQDLDMRKQRGDDVSIIVPNENHDDVEVHHLGEELKKKYLKVAEKNPNIVVYKSNGACAARIQDQLGGKDENIINHNTITNFMPGVPCYFYGGELGVHNDFERLAKRQVEQHEITNRLLKPAGLSKSLEDCLDPRELQRAEIPFEEVEKKKMRLPLKYFRSYLKPAPVSP